MPTLSASRSGLGHLRAACRRAVHREPAAAHAPHRQEQALAHSQAAEHERGLIGAAHPETDPAVRRQPGHVAAEQPDAPGARLLVARNQVEQCGLAGAVRPQNRPALTRPYRKRDLVQRRERPETPAHALQLQGVRGAVRVGYMQVGLPREGEPILA